MSLKTDLQEAASLLNASASDALERKMASAVDAIAGALAQNKALLVCGNGGSASDAAHIAGELVAQFLKQRRALKGAARLEIRLGRDPDMGLTPGPG